MAKSFQVLFPKPRSLLTHYNHIASLSLSAGVSHFLSEQCFCIVAESEFTCVSITTILEPGSTTEPFVYFAYFLFALMKIVNLSKAHSFVLCFKSNTYIYFR